MTTLLHQDLGGPPAAGSSADDERQAIIAAAIGEYRLRAFHQVTLQTVADRAERDLDEVRIHFATVDELVQEVTRAWYAQRMAAILPIAHQVGAVRFLRAVVVANIADPALMRLLAALVNVCAVEDHPSSAHLREQWLHFHALVHRTLAADVALGREPSTMDPARGAEQLIAMYEGLQLQAMVRPAMHLLDAYDQATIRLRRGWAEDCVPPVWDV